MGEVGTVELDLVDSVGTKCGKLILSLLPSMASAAPAGGPAPLLDFRADAAKDPQLEPVQLLEDVEYRYEVSLDNQSEAVTCDQAELFAPDTGDGTTGRLRAGSRTGRLLITFRAGASRVGNAAVEVRSRKLNYLNDYRWMLQDIARVMAEVVMERFAATEQQFKVDDARDAATLYQRFVFLQSLISGDQFQAAIHQVLSRPHRQWEESGELKTPGRGVRASSSVARQLARGDRRVAAPPHLPIASLPGALVVDRQEETLDTIPNRFVKFALERWRSVVAMVITVLSTERDSSATIRGLREANALQDELDALLNEPLIREVSSLTVFPGGSQVLQKREGYRELLRAYVEFEIASKLAWNGGEDVYGAGQRDVASLYEYWVFFELAEIVSSVCDAPLNLASLIDVREDGLAIDIRRGRHRILAGDVARSGRRLRIELWFNRTFVFGPKDDQSWTRQMRPDYSLRIHALDEDQLLDRADDIWLHFDAKYRIDRLAQAIDDEPGDEGPSSDEAGPRFADARRDDLLKMHAYRDAIRRSAGAYVLYPGTELRRFREFHEVLPGLGAFSLRPTDAGAAAGSGPLRRFLQDVIDHFASQLTQHQRSRYWRERSFSPETRVNRKGESVDFLEQPPADTRVLIGYVRSRAHLRWIKENRLYNLRADDRKGSVGLGSDELGADLLLTYGRQLDRGTVWKIADEPVLMTREQLLESGYPTPGGELYYCLRVNAIETGPWQDQRFEKRLTDLVERSSAERALGAPFTATWLDLMR